MPVPPDFYRFFYCAAHDRQRGPGIGRYGTGSRPLSADRPSSSVGVTREGAVGRFSRSSGFLGDGGGTGRGNRDGGRPWRPRRVPSKGQRQRSVGHRGNLGLVACSMSPSDSNGRGR